MIQYYIDNVEYMQHFVYLPALRILTDQVYTRLHHGQRVEPSHVALIFSVFACAGFFWTSHGITATTSLFMTAEAATKRSMEWTKATLDLLEHSRRRTPGSMEEIQATLILSFLIYIIEGFSSRARILFSNAIITARDLSLHIIDSPEYARRARGPPDSPVELEIKRRIWWQLVATDGSAPSDRMITDHVLTFSKYAGSLRWPARGDICDTSEAHESELATECP